MTPHVLDSPAPARPWARRWAAAVAFPRDGLARVRWICLLLALAPAALLAARLAPAVAPAWPLRAVAGAALAGLGAWWVRGYRRGRFPPGGLALEGLALLVIGLVGGPGALGLSYGGVYFRALYAPGWRVLTVWLTFAGAYLGALALGAGRAPLALLHPFNWAIIAGMTGGLAAALLERQRAAAELHGITGRARCLLWRAEITRREDWQGPLGPRDGAFVWRFALADVDAARQLVPLDVPPGRTYLEAWLASRLPEDRARADAVSAAALAGGRAAYRQEFRCRDKHGRERWLLEDVHLEPRGPGRWSAVGVCTDITARKQTEDALRRSEERLRAVVTNAPVVLYAVDRRGIYTLSEGKGLEALGRRSGEVVGRSIFDVFRDVPAIGANIRRALAGETFTTVARIGDAVFEAWYAPIRDARGAVDGALGLAVNITARVRAEEALRASEARHRELHAAAERQARELAVLDRVRTALARETDLAALFGVIVEAIAASFGHTYVSLYLLEGEELVRQGIVGPATGRLARIPVCRGVMGRVARTGVPVLLEDVTRDPDFIRGAEDIASEVCVPLFDQGRVVGVLNLESGGGARLGEDDLRLMTALGEHVGLALGRARLDAAVRASERRYRSVVEQVQEVLFQTDAAGAWTFLSPAWAAITGFPVAASLGRPFLDYVHPDDRARNLALFRPLIAGEEETCRHEIRYRTAAGGYRWIEVHARLTRAVDGTAAGTSGTLTDVTARKRAEETLHRRDAILAAVGFAAERFLARDDDWEAGVRAVLGRLGEATDVSRVYLFENHAGADGALLTSQRQEWAAPGVAPERANPALQGFDYRAAGFARWIETLGRGEPIHGPVCAFPAGERAVLAAQGIRSLLALPVAVDGRWWGFIGFDECRAERVWSAAEIEALRAAAGTLGAAIGRRRAEAALAHQATHDPLTNLPNRTLFFDRLGRALARERRARAPVAVLYLDLDRFKVINDSLGHAAGDRVLVAVAARLRAAVRPTDTVARFGGDEFAVLLEDLVDAGGAVRVAERILADLRAPLVLDGHELIVTPSIGIARGDPRWGRAEDLLRAADLAMYRAKQAGRARYAVFTPELDTAAAARLALEADLRRAVARDELVVHYQPLVELATGRVAGVEALVRWAHPERGLVPPGDFVPLAEETGLIVPLGRRVLVEACRQARAWQERWPAATPFHVAVNLSAREFQQPDLAGEVARALAAAGLAPDRLQLEITESALMEEAAASGATLRRLKALGVQLALDDFGTGYSSLAYLKRFPLDTLKIDKAFVDGLGRDPEDTAIVQAVLALARALGLRVVAEGVQRPEQLAQLRALGCEQGQGYYFARPLPPAAVDALLERGAVIAVAPGAGTLGARPDDDRAALPGG